MKLYFWFIAVFVALLTLFFGRVAGQPFVPSPDQEPLPMLRGEPVPRIGGDALRPWPAPMAAHLEVLVDGRPVSTIAWRGRTYLPVPRMGAEYALRVTNAGPRRIVAVLSVDGLSVISGQAASENQPGYIVSPGASVTIRGWRRDLSRVAAFRFVDRADAYASRMGQPDNIGVIGLIAIEELVLRSMPLPEFAREGALPKVTRADVGSVGTEYGRDLDSSAYYVPFARSNNQRRMTIHYDTVESLRQLGVPVDRSYPVPFPMDGPFAPPPPRRGE